MGNQFRRNKKKARHLEDLTITPHSRGQRITKIRDKVSRHAFLKGINEGPSCPPPLPPDIMRFIGELNLVQSKKIGMKRQAKNWQKSSDFNSSFVLNVFLAFLKSPNTILISC